jgi:hypothetical protein
MESGDTTSPQRENPAGTTARRRLVAGGIVVLGLIAVALWATGLGRRLIQRATYTGGPATFSGSSQKLTRTVIVPTLDSPCPPGRNVVWCSSFQLAWNEMKDKVVGAPLQVVGAEEVAARLNATKQSASDLDPKSFYIAGGSIKDGIVGKIKKDMAAKFPSHVLPDFNDYTDGIVSYSYLTANVPFKYPFEQVEEGLAFADSQGGKTQVDCFGLPETSHHKSKKTREQIEILYWRESDRSSKGHYWETSKCAIDLSKYSRPYQVIVALVEPKGSLDQTLEYVRAEIDKARRFMGRRELGRADILEVPEMVWKIDHRFFELIGKVLVNVKGPITEAMQTIEFRLDRSGAKVESEALLAAKSVPKRLTFDRPFLVYMQKRGAERPFFVMWVDNAELLVRR